MIGCRKLPFSTKCTGQVVTGQFVIRQFVIGQLIIGHFNKPITFKVVGSEINETTASKNTA